MKFQFLEWAWCFFSLFFSLNMLEHHLTITCRIVSVGIREENAKHYCPLEKAKHYHSFLLYVSNYCSVCSLLIQRWQWQACSDRETKNQRYNAQSENEELLAGEELLLSCLVTQPCHCLLANELLCREECAWHLRMKCSAGSMELSKRVSFSTSKSFFASRVLELKRKISVIFS